MELAVSLLIGFFIGASLFYYIGRQRELQALSEKINLESRVLDLERKKIELEEKEERRREQNDIRMIEWTHARQEVERDRLAFKQAEETRQQEMSEARRLNWSRHESDVIRRLTHLCAQLGIESYTGENFPLEKKPDFAIVVADQYVIFDAKAPADPTKLNNFTQYLRDQAGRLDKYLKQEGIRSDAFLVVPSDTMTEVSGEHCLEIKGYRVHIVPADGLESVIRLLLKIEDYETVESLGAEDQERLATFIGRSSRLIKRRVQIDQFLSSKLIDLLDLQEELVPEELLRLAKDKEKTFPVNPPKLDRRKDLTVADLKKSQDLLIPSK